MAEVIGPTAQVTSPRERTQEPASTEAGSSSAKDLVSPQAALDVLEPPATPELIARNMGLAHRTLPSESAEPREVEDAWSPGAVVPAVASSSTLLKDHHGLGTGASDEAVDQFQASSRETTPSAPIGQGPRRARKRKRLARPRVWVWAAIGLCAAAVGLAVALRA